MSLVAKISIFLFILFVNWAHAKDIYILIVGQSFSSTCNDSKLDNFKEIYQINLQGNKVSASAPSLWADCNQGSMWVSLGNQLISSGFAKTITFMPIGIADASVMEWLPQGRAFDKLEKAISVVNSKSLRFDYAFWYQISPVVENNPRVYTKNLNALLSYFSLNTKIDKWIIASHPKCGASFDKRIANAQYLVSLNHLAKRFPGPDSNILGKEFRLDGCNFNNAGQVKMAELWFNSILEAENVNLSVQHESLIFFFKHLFGWQ